MIVRGGARLAGRVEVDGSKNAALPLLAAAACLPGRSVRNVPTCIDVSVMAGLLGELGWKITAGTGPGELVVGPLSPAAVQPAAASAGAIRGSYYLVPAVVGGYGRASLPWPGGCSVGERGMDVHFAVYAAFGDEVETGPGGYTVRAAARPRRGTVRVDLPFRSRGSTVAALLRAVAAGRSVTIGNPSLCAELHAVYRALVAAGCALEVGGERVELCPPGRASSAGWRVPGDKIEAGTLACAIAATGGRGYVDGADPADTGPLAAALGVLGVPVTTGTGPDGTGRLTVTGPPGDGTGSLTARASLEPDGLDADWEPGLMALALGRPGRHVFADAVNPGRHGNLLPELAALGAAITADSPVECHLTGPQSLTGGRVRAADIRTGSALLIAALSARGTSTVTGLAQLRRGHADLPAKLAALGAAVEYCQAAPDSYGYGTGQCSEAGT